MTPVVVTREIDCEAGRRAVWGLITDTDRLNRLSGLPPVELRPVELDEARGAARYVARLQLGPELVLEYEERPYEWIEGERFSILRKMISGPLTNLEMIYGLETSPKGGTRVTLRLSLICADDDFVPVANGLAEQTLQGMEKALGELDARAVTGRWRALSAVDVNREVLERAGKDLETRVDPVLSDNLVRMIESADDSEVVRIRPFELADTWDRSRKEVLIACLEAVQSGLLELRWDLVCPSCRTASDRVGSLNELVEHGACQLCDLSFDLELDRSVEATFSPAHAVREVAEVTYCIGGPARTPHVVSQIILTPDDEGLLQVPDETGRFRLFVRGGVTATVEVDPSGPETATATVDAEGIDPPSLKVAPKGMVIVRWQGERARHAKLERLEFASRAATAHHVSTLPGFRKQFSEQILRDDLALKVGRVAIFFSDLTGSTQLYTDVGDAVAFKLVQDHFVLLRRIIAEYEGTIVKTIGDAVMAAYEDEARAVKAAVAMLLAFPEFAAAQGQPHVGLKLGLHTGACYAVTANDQLDYFGQCVNQAARLQGQAKNNELVLTEDCAARADDAGWLKGTTIGAHFMAELKGLAEPIPCVRIVVEA